MQRADVIIGNSVPKTARDPSRHTALPSLNTACQQDQEGTVRFWLPKHVFVACVEDGLVFLDLRADKYFAVSTEHHRAMVPIIAGLPSPPAHDRGSKQPSHRSSAQITDVLVAKGLLTATSTSGKPATPAALDSDAMHPMGQGTEFEYPVHARHIVDFLLACSRAAWLLRWRSLEAAVRAVECKKANRRGPGAHFDMSRATELVSVFRHLRLYLFAPHGSCLFHALALVIFMSRYGLFPNWVIGVQSGPFAAHSWVQQGAFVLDCTPEDVCYFKPILVV
ncbi:MAG: lasso peptide biosynthesis B2 protein [Gammaproteobacteria bacterium]